MFTTHRVRPSLAGAGLFAAALLAGCGDVNRLAPTAPADLRSPDVQSASDRLSPLAGPSLAAVPTPSQVIVSDGDGGAFRSFVVDHVGRNAGQEFWDNFSADDRDGNVNCNVGYYAIGAMSPNCGEQVPGSNANQGGYAGGTYWAKGLNLPSAFMFSGAYSYTVKALGSYASIVSRTGYFTKTGTSYTFYPLNLAIGASTTINTGGLNWGFYISNDFNPQPGGCKTSPATHCSDATGGYTMVPYQQFALFTNVTGTSYLVGAEDNKLETLPNANKYDSDYQDYMMSVVPGAVTSCNDDAKDDKNGKIKGKNDKNQNGCDDDKNKKCDADKSLKDPKSHDENHDCRSESGEQHDKKYHG